MLDLSPVAVFSYRRPRHLEKVLKALAGEPEAKATQIILFLDGARGLSDRSDVAAVRKVAEEAKGFQDIRICAAEKNKGLARSITDGVGTVCQEHGETIVLEDDIVPQPGFLSFMNEALSKYRDNHNVMQISGYAYPIQNELLGHVFLPLTSCWGWATWQRAWIENHWDREKAQKDLEDPEFVSRFDLGGAYPYSRLLHDVIKGKSNSWAIVWYWNVFRCGGLSLFPSTSLVENIGWDGSGTHGEKEEDSFGTCDLSIPYGNLSWPNKIEVDPKDFQDVRQCILARQQKREARIQNKKIIKRIWKRLVSSLTKVYQRNAS